MTSPDREARAAVEKDAARAFDRRLFLGAALATGLAATGCTRPAAVALPPAAVTVSTLIQQDPFYIAHRGGGGNWPELTAYAYEQAAKVPHLKALEISVCLTSDGVLVCSHDPTTTRMTGERYVIADETWKTLSTLEVSSRETTDTRQPARPFTRFDEVADRYIDDFVLFVEPKVPAASLPLLTKLAALGQPQRVVWKQPVNSTRFQSAKDAGFSTWGYVLDAKEHLGSNLARFAASPTIDLLGAPVVQSDAFAERIIEAARHFGKQTVMWPISNLDQRARALRLGCTGLMTSKVTELVNAPL